MVKITQFIVESNEGTQEPTNFTKYMESNLKVHPTSNKGSYI